MSVQNFTPAHRHAIWKAYGYKCFYCHTPVTWDELRIDHIIPETLIGKTDKLALILKDLALEPTWNLQADHNLVATCDGCNHRKLALIPPRNQMILWLTEAAGHSAKVNRLRLRFERKRKTGTIRAQLEIAVASGWIDEAEVRAALRGVHGAKTPIALTTSIEFMDGVTLDALRPGEVEALFDRPVKLGAYLPNGLKLERGDGATVCVRTCREYRHAIATGFWAPTTFAMKMEAFFKTACGLLEAMAACRPAMTSFIENPRVGLCDIYLVPSSLLPLIGEEDSEEANALVRYPTIGKLVDAGWAKVAGVSSSILELEVAGQRILIRELFRADVDGDGSEDLLISIYCYMTGGTLGFGSNPVALARKSADHVLEVTNFVPPPIKDKIKHEDA